MCILHRERETQRESQREKETKPERLIPKAIMSSKADFYVIYEYFKIYKITFMKKIVLIVKINIKNYI